MISEAVWVQGVIRGRSDDCSSMCGSSRACDKLKPQDMVSGEITHNIERGRD